MMNSYKKIDWLGAVFYPLALVLMEAFWVYPWQTWIGGWPLFPQPRPPLSLATVVIVLAAAALGTRFIQRLKWPVWLAQLIIIGGGLSIMLLALGIEYRAGFAFLSGGWFTYLRQVFGNLLNHPETIVVALPVLFYLWWRGINLGQAAASFKSVYGPFILGMVALILLVIIWQVSAASGRYVKPGVGLGFDIIAFFFFGLLAIAISHLYQMRRVTAREEGGAAPVWRWLPAMVAVIGGMIAVGFGIAGIFSAGFFAAVGRGFGLAFDFIWKILNYVLVPFNYLFEGIIWLLRLIVNFLRGSQPLQPGGSGNTTAPPFPEVTTRTLPPEVALVIKWLAIAAVCAAVIYVLARAVSRLRARREEEEIEEIHESLFSWQKLGQDLRDLLGGLGKRLQRKPSPVGSTEYIEDDNRRLDIREIYRRLLWEASRAGLIRFRQETPAEYSYRLGRLMPESREPLSQLTEIYMGVRYGELKAPEEQVDSANGLWRRLRDLLRGAEGTS